MTRCAGPRCATTTRPARGGTSSTSGSRARPGPPTERGGGRGGERVGGGPVSVRVEASGLDGYTTRCRGAGVTRCTAARRAEFAVLGRDRFQNPAAGGRLRVRLLPHGVEPGGLEVRVGPGPGEYRVEYTAPPASGVYMLAVGAGA